MKVCDLKALLSRADPESDLVLETCTGRLLLITVRPGMHQIVEDCIAFTVEEEKWLQEMHVQW